MLLFANLTRALALGLLRPRGSTSTLDLLVVMAVGAFNGINNMAAVAEGNRLLPGQASGVSALLMGLPWCIAALGPVVAGGRGVLRRLARRGAQPQRAGRGRGSGCPCERPVAGPMARGHRLTRARRGAAEGLGYRHPLSHSGVSRMYELTAAASSAPGSGDAA